MRDGLKAPFGPVPGSLATSGDDAGDKPKGYPGAKSGAGVWQRLISMMPPHDFYVEAFAGGASILRAKRPASSSLAIESDADQFDRLRELWRDDESTLVTKADAREILPRLHELGHDPDRTLIYCDPPYLGSTRRGGGSRRLYRSELRTEGEHRELLDILCSLDQMVMLSGYRSPLYDRRLDKWRRVDYLTRTHRATVIESVWCNFPEPAELHDYRWLGKDFRERERINRRVRRWAERLLGMPALERAAVLAGLGENPCSLAMSGDKISEP
jgi:site-specific DNA-adenine methylase